MSKLRYENTRYCNTRSNLRWYVSEHQAWLAYQLVGYVNKYHLIAKLPTEFNSQQLPQIL